MRRFWRLTVFQAFVFLLHGASAAAHPGPVDASSIIPFLSEWRLIDHIPLHFDAFHTQGLVKIGPKFYLSAVEVLESTEGCKEWKTGFSRTAGKGVAHLFEFDGEGRLLRDIRLGGDTLY